MLLNHISVVVVVYDVCFFQSFDGEKLDDYQGDGTGRKVKMPPFKSPSVVSTVSRIYIKGNTRPPRGFLLPRREKTQKEAARENLWLQTTRILLSCYNRCQHKINNKQPIATHLSGNNSQSGYAMRFLQSEGSVRS